MFAKEVMPMQYAVAYARGGSLGPDGTQRDQKHVIHHAL
jgi:hypothetical protein